MQYLMVDDNQAAFLKWAYEVSEQIQ